MSVELKTQAELKPYTKVVKMPNGVMQTRFFSAQPGGDCLGYGFSSIAVLKKAVRDYMHSVTNTLIYKKYGMEFHNYC